MHLYIQRLFYCVCSAPEFHGQRVFEVLYLAHVKAGSFTSQRMVFLRYQAYVVGMCDDSMAIDLLPVSMQLACLSELLTWILLDRFPIAHDVCGRCDYIDRVIRNLDADFEQIVLLRAGYDTRFHRIPNLPVSLFELDSPKTQTIKIQKLKTRNPNVKFIPVSFESESWLRKLLDSGFKTDKKTLFVLEGMLYYLTDSAIRSTLKCISQCAKGSKLTLDYHTIVKGGPELEQLLQMFQKIGEPLLSLLTDEEILALLEQHSLSADGHPGWTDAVVRESDEFRGRVERRRPAAVVTVRQKLLSATVC